MIRRQFSKTHCVSFKYSNNLILFIRFTLTVNASTKHILCRNVEIRAPSMAEADTIHNLHHRMQSYNGMIFELFLL